MSLPLTVIVSLPSAIAFLIFLLNQLHGVVPGRVGINMRFFSPEEAERVANSLQAITCEAFHDGPCMHFWLSYFGTAVLASLKFYIPLQFLPLLARLKQLRKE